MTQRIPVPESTKRVVRQEAFFGCAICGNPLIEYAHIIPYELSDDNRAENLVALCPNDHTEYDLDAFTEQQIRDYKSNPFNRGRDIKKTFSINGTFPVIERALEKNFLLLKQFLNICEINTRIYQYVLIVFCCLLVDEN